MAEDKETTLLGHSLIWFGAAISIAEILTGTLFAPLGFWKAFAAIVIGHALGCILLYCSGVICARQQKCAMDAVKLTFGTHGGKIFAIFNVLQLIGWTAVMIATGAQAADGILNIAVGNWCWALLIGALILLWIHLKFGLLEKTNLVAMLLLFLLSILLSRLIFKSPVSEMHEGTLSFGAALEWSIAMPVSWLPLIGDYTCNSSRPRLASLISAGIYFVASCWMYLVGLGAVLFLGNTDIAVIMQNAGLGIAAFIIVILSTVTTTYLDVYSAGISVKSVLPKLNAKVAASVVCLAGIALAIICNTSSFESFLYWIGSIFVPMAVVQITAELLLQKRKSAMLNLILWLIGFVIYRVFIYLDLPVGSTIPDIILTTVLCFAANIFIHKIHKTHKKIQ